jgi:hypothetical protein
MMADIDIVHRRRTSVWIWIALAIVALAVLFLLFGIMSTPRSVVEGADAGGLTTQAARAWSSSGHLT